MIIKNFDELRKALDNKEKAIEFNSFEEYEFKGEPIVIVNPVTIKGNSALIKGDNNVVFVISSSDTTITDLRFAHVKSAVAIDGLGKSISNIEVSNICVKNFSGKAIDIASSKSNSTMKDLRIVFNKFVGKDGFETETLDGFTVPINVCAAFAKGHEDVDNCVLDGLLIAHNTTKGGHRLGINLCTSSCDYNHDPMNAGWRQSPVLKNLKILDNDLDGGWDSTINIIGGTLHQKDGLFENCEIAYNRVSYGVWGIGGVAMEPIFGAMEDSLLKNFDVHHNVCVPQACGAGEKQHAIAFCAGRIDFFHNTKCIRAGFEDLLIHHNEIYNTDRGVMISATDSVLDGANSEMDSCFVKHCEITNNKLYGVIEAFLVVGSYLEGRLFDWNIGVPLHNKAWSELFKDDNIVSCVSHDNYVTDVVIKDNYVKGNRYKYCLYGCLAHGHALMKNNKLEIKEISNNVFEETEGHLDVKLMQIDDFVQDGGGNEFDISWKYKI